MSLKNTKIGILWGFLNQAGSQILYLIVTFILARLITPAEFGIIGMIAVFTGFAKIFVDFGFSNALIQKSEINQCDINTVFCFNLISGGLLSVLFFTFGYLVADFYNEPLLEKILKIYSPIFFISALGGVNQALIIKKLKFKLLSIISLVTIALSSTTAIIMGLYGYGVWSILTKIILEQILLTLLMIIFNPVRQKFVFKGSSFKSLSKNGFNMAGDSVVNYWSRNADNLIIGRFLGEGALGIYTKSYAIMMLPLLNISRVIAKVMFPTLSNLQQDLFQVRNLYLKATGLIGYITFPLMVGIAILSKPFVLTAFGSTWLEMIPIITVLSGVGAIQSISTLNGVIFNSLGKAEIAFRISIVSTLVNVAAFIVGLKMGGLMGLVIAYAIVSVLISAPIFYFAGKQIGVTLTHMAKNLQRSIVASILMGIVVFWSYQSLSKFKLGSLIELLVPSLTGGLFYLAIGYFLKFEEFHLIQNLLKKKNNN